MGITKIKIHFVGQSFFDNPVISFVVVVQLNAKIVLVDLYCIEID